MFGRKLQVTLVIDAHYVIGGHVDCPDSISKRYLNLDVCPHIQVTQYFHGQGVLGRMRCKR